MYRTLFPSRAQTQKSFRPRFLRPTLERLEDRTVPAANLFGPGGMLIGSFSTIQAAVGAAAPSGDTIKVDPGTYTEQVTINKSLTLEGSGLGAIIQAPTTALTTNPNFGFNSLVTVGNPTMVITVNIKGLTIQGPNTTIDNGIYVAGGATANVTGTTIANINRGPGLFGLQTGRGILVGSTGRSQVGHAVITNSTITDYQKSGIVTGGNGTTVTVTGTTITGVGPTAVIAQNGIDINPGTTTATITSNTISGNEFIGTNSGPNPISNTQSDGILIDGSSPSPGTPNTVVTVMNNTISGNDDGINSIPNLFTVTISGNTVKNNRFEGMVLEQGTTAVSNNTITGNNIGVAVIATMLDAFGTPVTVDAQANLVSNNITNNGNVPVGFPGGGIVLMNENGATTTARLTAHFNRIVGNSVGLNNETMTLADAINNWWGSNAGPAVAGKGSDTAVGPVDFSPWLVLHITATPTRLLPGGVATVVADLTHNSAGADTSALGRVPNGIPVAFGATFGAVAPAAGVTVAGKAVTTFRAGRNPGAATASARVDNQTVTATFEVLVPPTFLGKVLLLRSANVFGAIGFVNSLYLDALRRLPDQAALNHWVWLLLSGVPRAQVAAAILALA
jgi:parallel beta-helix repeat protein